MREVILGGISTSGNSANVLKAMEVAKAKGIKVVGLEEEKTVVKAGDRVSVVLYAALKTTSRNEDKTLCQAA